MENESKFKGPINLGNPNEFTVSELAHKVLGLLPKSRSKIVYKILPEDDPKRRQPDITLAKNKLGWKPVVKVDTGLVKTIKYFESQIAANWSK